MRDDARERLDCSEAALPNEGRSLDGKVPGNGAAPMPNLQVL
jgi:hypothetical protein